MQAQQVVREWDHLNTWRRLQYQLMQVSPCPQYPLRNTTTCLCLVDTLSISCDGRMNALMIQRPGYAFPLLWLAPCWSQVDIYSRPQITSLRTSTQPAFQWWPYLLRYRASNSQNCQQPNLQPQGSPCEYCGVGSEVGAQIPELNTRMKLSHS